MTFWNRQLFSTAIFLAVALGAIPARAETDGDWEYSFSDTDYTATVTKYNGSAASVSVPSKFYRNVQVYEQIDNGEWEYRWRTYTYRVTAVSETFSGNTRITSVSLPTSVTTIGWHAFSGCRSLTAINLTDAISSIGSQAFSECENVDFGHLSLSNLRTVGEWAFYGCSGLTSVTLGPSVTSLGRAAFSNCGRLEAVTVDSPVALPASLFSNCTNLTTVTIGDNVTSLGPDEGAPFSYCPRIRTFSIGRGITSIPNYYFSSYYRTYGGISFPASATIERIDLPDTVTAIGSYAFYGCENVDFGHLSLPNLASIGSCAFYGCRELEPFAFPGTLAIIGDAAFSGCVKFRTVTLGPNITTLGSRAFSGCDQITSVTVNCPTTLPGNLFGDCSNLVTVVIGDNVKGLGTVGTNINNPSHPFLHCPAIRTFRIGNGITSIPDYYFTDAIYNTSYAFSAGPTIERIDLPDTITAIGSSAFSGCRSLTAVNLTDALTSIGSSAFYGCRSLTAINLTDALTSIGSHAFSECENVDFGHLSLSNLRTVGEWAFYGCSGLTSVTLGPSVTSLGRAAFSNCGRLEAVTVDSPVALPASLFSNCTNLTTVTIGDNVTSLGPDEGAPFSYCPRIRTFSIGRGITSIPNYYFSSYYRTYGGISFPASATIERIDLPDTVTAIGSYAFYGCENVDFGHLSLPNLASIGSCAFYGCRELEPFAFPGTLAIIGDAAFSGCVKFRTVTLGPNITTLGSRAFSGCDQITSVTVNCPTTLPGNLFGDCSNLVTVVIGDNVKGLGTVGTNINNPSHPFLHCPAIRTFRIGNGITSIPDYYFTDAIYNTSYAFSAGPTIERIDLPDTITAIGSSAFSGCRSLTAVNLTDALTSIGSSAFYGCAGLASVSLPNSLQTISCSCFSSCTALEKVTIPKSVTRIDSSAFQYCSTLTNVWFKGTPPTVGSAAFFDVAPSARGHYPQSLANEWLPQIGSDGKWNGLIMHQLSQPILRVDSASPVNGTITLAWDDGTDNQCVSSYSIYRGPGPERLPEYLVSNATGITETTWTDNNYWNAEPVLSPLNYWVIAESDRFDLPESNRVETRHRYGLAVGCDKYSPCQVDGQSLQHYADVPANKSEAETFANLFFPGTKVLTGTGATISAIRREMTSFAGKVKPGDLFAFFFSTHGGPTEIKNGEEVSAGLMAYDGDFSAADVAEAVAAINAQSRVICIFSSCFAAHMTDMGYWASAAERERLAQRGLSYCPLNVAWIGASSFNEESVDYDGPYGTASEFGHYFLECGWRDGYADAKTKGTDWPGGNKDGRITLGELVGYAREFSRGRSDEEPATVFSNSAFDLDSVFLKVDIPEQTAESLPVPGNVTVKRSKFMQGAYISWNGVGEAKTYRVFRRMAGETDSGKCVAYGVRDNFWTDIPPTTTQTWEYAISAASDLAVGPLSEFSPIVVQNSGEITLYYNNSDEEGGGDTTNITATIGAIYGDNLNITPLREGYSFLGWHARKDGELVTTGSVVRVQDADGLEAFWGRDGMACTATESLTSTEAKVSWAADAGAVSYLVFRSETNDCLTATSIASVSAGTSFTDESVEEGIAYHYWVAPVTTAGIGPISATSTMAIRPKTKESPVPVLHEWLDAYGLVSGGDYETAAQSVADMGRPVWECYIAGLDPTNAISRLEARITMTADGQPVISWSPDLNEGGTKQERIYTVEGRESLTEGSWGPTNANSRFFRVKVDLP